MSDLPMLYTDLARWWPLLSPPEHYAAEARLFRDLILEHGADDGNRLVEFGSGGGNTASHLKAWFDVTLVDLSSEMLAVSRGLNPECRHLVGDMRDARLGEVFDAVFVHDAVCFMTTPDDLALAVETAFVHCKRGGVALFVPDYTAETFHPRADIGGSDGSDRAIRYLEWVTDPDPHDHRYRVDFAYMLREGDEVRVIHDRHDQGLFTVDEWIRTIAAAGFEPAVGGRAVQGDDPQGRVFVGVKR